MGLFSRKAELSPPNVPADWINSRVWMTWDPPRNMIRGESHNQAAIRGLCVMKGEPREQGYLQAVCVDLVREPKNPYDRSAIAAHVGKAHVGYLGKEFAAQVSPALDRHKLTTVRVCGVIRGGTINAPSLGVHVWLDRRPVPGPSILHADATHIVAWPPWHGEGEEG